MLDSNKTHIDGNKQILNLANSSMKYIIMYYEGRNCCLSFKDKFYICKNAQTTLKVARLDFLGEYLPSLNVNYVGVSRDMEKKLPQLYYIKMKLSYDLGFLAIGVAIAT